jgi:hypothetical protein
MPKNRLKNLIDNIFKTAANARAFAHTFLSHINKSNQKRMQQANVLSF